MPEQCQYKVTYNKNWAKTRDCLRKAVKDTSFCTQHSDEQVKIREANSRATQEQKIKTHRYEYCGKYFYDVLKEIALGVDDPIGKAKVAVNKFEKGFSW